MKKLDIFFEPDGFVHFIQCLLSNPGHFEYRTMSSHVSIRSEANIEDLQREIYNWLARRVDSASQEN